MSETTTNPEAVAEPPEEPKPQPAEGEQQTQPEGEQPDAEAEEKRIARRLNRLNSRVAMLSRTNEQLQAQLAQAHAQQRQQPGNGQQAVDPQLQQYIDQQVAQGVQAKLDAAKTRAFHAEGSELYPDWTERCTALQAMGADPHIAKLLVGMRNGPRVAAALHDAPEELDRIASLDADDRATALGEFAAKLATKSARPVSKAPRPPQPVTQRTAPVFNEYIASTEELLKHYSRPGAKPP